MQKIRIFEAFSGIGAQAMACKRLQKMFPETAIDAKTFLEDYFKIDLTL